MRLVTSLLATRRALLQLPQVRLRRSPFTRLATPLLVLRLACRRPLRRASPRRFRNMRRVTALTATHRMFRPLALRRRRRLMGRVMSHRVLLPTFLPFQLAALPKSRLMRRAMLRPVIRPTSRLPPLARAQRPRIMRATLRRVSRPVSPLVLRPLVRPTRCLPMLPATPRPALRPECLPPPLASPRRLLAGLVTSPTAARRLRLRVPRPRVSLLKARPMRRATVPRLVPRPGCPPLPLASL